MVEGFKRDLHPKLEVFRAANGRPWLHPEDPAIRAVVSDAPPAGGLPHAGLDEIERVADLVLEFAAPWHG